ncbi:MAG: hypothetical protein WA160_00120 [Pseudobdellovibrio sp.]
MRKIHLSLIALAFLSSLFFSCAPVKFSKADSFTVNPACSGSGCGSSGQQITCSPKINSTFTTFTYTTGAALPNITSSCLPSNVDFSWLVKRADSSVVSSTIPGLTGQDPQAVNFMVLSPGTYYVYLNASQTGSVYSPFVATTPLEFIVPGVDVGNQLTCDPKLNQTFTNVVVNGSDANALVSANCNPAAGMYNWTVKKNGSDITISGLSGASSTPDLKSYGAGTYLIKLYATAASSQHWQSSAPLTVTVTNPTVPPNGVIACNPRINGSLTSLTLTSSSANPLISANCLPTTVQYTWSITKNGNTISVPALNGANSNPDILSMGMGTYLIYLTASAPGYSTWNTTTPLMLTVDTNTGGGVTLSCAPRLNTTSVAVTIPQNGANPLVTSGCNPSSVTHTWMVFKNGLPVTISGLAGPSSTPGFIAAGLGTYYIYLTATAPGYNAYVSPSPLAVTISTVDSPIRQVTFQKLVQVTDNKVDVLVVVDDSNSMLPDNVKLSQKLQGFVTSLTTAGIDWQMCATVTHSQLANSTMYWGLSRNWTGYIGTPQWILNPGAVDPYGIFTNTILAIGAGWANTDDERGIKAAWWNVEYNPYNSCHRQDASLAVIVLSDEDERSVGGDSSQTFYNGEFQLLEGDDQAYGFVNKIKQTFGLLKRVSVNSIIVKPGDAACMAAQDAGGAKSHYGYKYNELSQLTGGYVGSICDADYSSNLYYFKDRLVNSLASIPLECAAVGVISVDISPSMGAVNTQMQNNNLIFSPAIPAGRTVTVKYNCPQT